MVKDDITTLVNYSEIVKYLYYNKVASNTDISSYIHKSIPNTLKVLNELIKDGYVKENGLGISSGGRKPLTYSLIPNELFILSVAMDQFATQMVIVDINNTFVTPVGYYKFDLYRQTEGIDTLTNYINKFIENSGIARNKILGLGISMPGFIDVEKGINHSYLRLTDDTLVSHLEKSTLLPVFIDNDSTAIALAEQKFGIAADKKNVMVINLGWGIGLGMILNGEIFRGHNGLAGEFSHIPLFKNGKLCTCGKHGCLETEASFIAVAAKATEGIKQGFASSLAGYDVIDADAIIKEAIKGDIFSVKLLSEAAYLVGQGLAILIHLMNPAAIVLSGKGSIVGKLWMAPIQQAINEHCIPKLTDQTALLISNLNSKAQLIGSAALVVESLGKLFQSKLTAIHNQQTALESSY
ncbi:putative NBD/HSP70 family sugar kinase [Mucilaginibacter gracilis]|uniref:Putative NBD/HSP70 family sugar kinase n=1 Tax=Mucilaginibacter gracilis TaxID=423350 RepID=A0A495J6C0_9SPHI|nr:ROK family protein [Mucilaginibacter gracilis]RKR84535.1 putative NBD/HSP70 family sugar kinase [Mucilaginibacter gracilis]